MVAMMSGGTPASTAPIPTQTFAAQNIIGTPVPMIGDAGGRPNYAATVGKTISPNHVVFTVVGLIGIGYILYHFNFEK